MAKAIYQKKSEAYGIESIFSSAALGFCHESGVSPNAVRVCNEIDIDLSYHKPRIIRERDINITDIFVVMTQGHAQTLMAEGVPLSKIYILGGGIPDPYGSDLVTYRRCRRMIEAGLDEFCKMLIEKYPKETKKDKENSGNESDDYIYD